MFSAGNEAPDAPRREGGSPQSPFSVHHQRPALSHHHPMAEHWRRWYQLERWRKRRRAHLLREPLCVYCLKKGRVEPATIADHIRHHGGDWNEFMLGALQSLCAPCHSSTKHLEEIRGYDKTIGLDGWPTDPRHPAYQGTAQPKRIAK